MMPVRSYLTYIDAKVSVLYSVSRYILYKKSRNISYERNPNMYPLKTHCDIHRLQQRNISICPFHTPVYQSSTHWLSYLNSIGQRSSWEANGPSASQEIPSISWKLNVHYCIHNSPLLVPILRQINQVHFPPSHFWIIHWNIMAVSRNMNRISKDGRTSDNPWKVKGPQLYQ
jgi:hypothetical protein